MQNTITAAMVLHDTGACTHPSYDPIWCSLAWGPGFVPGGDTACDSATPCTIGWAHRRAECGGFPCHVNGDNYAAREGTIAAVNFDPPPFSSRSYPHVWHSFAARVVVDPRGTHALVAIPGGSTMCEVAP